MSGLTIGWPDGFSGAPTGTVQFPSLLNSYGGTSSRQTGPIGGKQYQPPWHVAGVDYFVGVPSNVSLQDPGVNCVTIIAALGGSSNASFSSINLTLKASNLTIDSWDFSLHGGYGVVIQSGVTNTIIKNSKFEVVTTSSPPPVNCQSGAGNLTTLTCEFDGNSTNDAASISNAITYNGTGTFVCKYCYFHELWQHGIDFDGSAATTQTHTVEFNLFKDCGVGTGQHADNWYFDGPVISNSVYQFNTIYWTNLIEGGLGGNYTTFFGTDNVATGAALTDSTLSNNTIVPTGPNCVSYIFGFINQNTPNNIFTGNSAFNNYFDPTNALGTWYPSSGGSNYGTGSTSGGNINMVTASETASPFGG